MRRVSVGDRFGRLVVTELLRRGECFVQCDCGVTKKLLRSNLRTTKSCGCLRRGGNPRKHGHAKAGQRSRIYRTWAAIKTRCTNPNAGNYKYYGGRGVRMCDRWQESFGNFLEDMGAPPSAEHSIDRINNDGDYCPENCRWATRIEQTSNQRTNRILEIGGEKMTLQEASRRFGIHRTTIATRLRRGVPADLAVIKSVA